MSTYKGRTVTVSDTVDCVQSPADEAAVSAAVAVLVADAASPTQAHVTTLNTAWSAFLTKSHDLQVIRFADGGMQKVNAKEVT